MATTIQISERLQAELLKMKLYDKETYEEVIWDLIEDTMALSKETQRDVALSRQEAKAGKTRSLSLVRQDVRCRAH